MPAPHPSARRGVTYLDVLVATVLIVVLCGAVLPAAVFKARETANRAKCASNLRQIGQAELLYANENNGSYARTIYDVSKADKPTAFTGSGATDPFKAGGPAANDVTAPMFLLLRTEDLVAVVFACPSTHARAWDYGGGRTPLQASNFPDGRCLSYSLFNPYPNQATVNDGFKITSDFMTADVPMAADGNPGGADLLHLSVKSAQVDQQKGNSRNHQSEGQNVLYGDGHVEFTQNPFAGVKQDNIYTFGPSGDDQNTGGTGIVGSPVGKSDTVLLPVLEEAKPATRPATRPTTFPAPRTKVAWTEDAVREQLALNPHDAYLQYVLMQLGRREDQDLAGDVRELMGEANDGSTRRGRGDVDVIGLFTGALAVQESLQLDAMSGPAAQPTSRPASTQPAATGPQVQSHPWRQMLAGRTPVVSALSKCVPADYYFVESRSITKINDAIAAADGPLAKLASQGLGQARELDLVERGRRQLAIRDEPLLRPFYDEVVDGVAITGSDPFLREGSDFTLLFHLAQPELFHPEVDAFMDAAEKATPGAVRGAGEVQGVKYVSLVSPDRSVCVFAADPAPDVHVRSNSKVALEHVLAAMKDDGRLSLGKSDEFAYVRTLMPAGAAEEDVLVYLSDPFIRRLVGRELRLTERRRVVCYNGLRMLSHASLMFQTEVGRAPKSVEELKQAACLSEDFGQGERACTSGGTYALSPDGLCGECSVHGRADRMTPCAEIPLKDVTPEESDSYSAFVEEYNQYWKHYFDPIAVRLQVTPERLRAETIILPLIDNSIYTRLAGVLGGKPEALDALPVPNRNILSVALRLNKDELLKNVPDGEDARSGMEDLLGKRGGDLDVKAFLTRGLGNAVGFHVYDAPQNFGLNVPEFLGQILPLVASGGEGDNATALLIAPLIVSLNSPVYLSFPVQDAKVVDDFLAKADAALAAEARGSTALGGFFRFERDFYGTGATRRSHVLRIGPVTWRFCWERIGDGFYVASKPFILDDLRAAGAAKPNAEDAAAATGHATVRVRPDHFNAVLPEYRLDWAENNRRACLDNLAPLSDAARALAGHHATSQPASSDDAQRRAFALLGARLVCPDGGHYELSPDGTHVTCSVHGSALNPRQPAEAAATTSLYGTSGVTGTLTFMPDGLKAVVTVKRR